MWAKNAKASTASVVSVIKIVIGKGKGGFATLLFINGTAGGHQLTPTNKRCLPHNADERDLDKKVTSNIQYFYSLSSSKYRIKKKLIEESVQSTRQ